MADGGFSLALSQRVPPSNLQAEQALLGALLANNRCYDRVAEFLEPKHFADPIHGLIYHRITERLLNGQLADAVTLKADLDNTGMLEEAGGTAYLAQLLSSLVGIATVPGYARVIVESWTRRQLINIAEVIANNALGHDPSLDASRQIDLAERALVELQTAGKSTTALCSAGDAIAQALADAEDAYRTGKTPGVRFGMPTIDKALDGLVDRDTLTLLGGLPAGGKTALVVQMGKSLALRTYADAIRRGLTPEQAYRQPGMLMISLEMKAKQLGFRMAAHEIDMSMTDLRNGKLDEIAGISLSSAVNRTRHIPFRIHDMVGVNVRLLPQKIMMHLQRQPEQVVVIDNLLTRGADDDGNGKKSGLDASTVSWLTGQLKALASRCGVPIIALTHIPRPQAGVVRRPVQNDVKWAGEGDADNVVFVHRPIMLMDSSPPAQSPRESEDAYSKRRWRWQQERDKAADLAEIVVAKARQGAGGVYRMRFYGPTTSFHERDE